MQKLEMYVVRHIKMLLLSSRKRPRGSYHLLVQVVIVVMDFGCPTADDGISLCNDQKSLFNDEITMSRYDKTVKILSLPFVRYHNFDTSTRYLPPTQILQDYFSWGFCLGSTKAFACV